MKKRELQQNVVPSKQGRAFIEAARALDCSESTDAFDENLKRIASAPPPKSAKKRKTKKPAK